MCTISRQNVVKKSSRFRALPWCSGIIITIELTNIRSKLLPEHKTLPPKGPFALPRRVRKGGFWGHGKMSFSRVHAHTGEEDACRMLFQWAFGRLPNGNSTAVLLYRLLVAQSGSVLAVIPSNFFTSSTAAVYVKSRCVVLTNISFFMKSSSSCDHGQARSAR